MKTTKMMRPTPPNRHVPVAALRSEVRGADKDVWDAVQAGLPVRAAADGPTVHHVRVHQPSTMMMMMMMMMKRNVTRRTKTGRAVAGEREVLAQPDGDPKDWDPKDGDPKDSGVRVVGSDLHRDRHFVARAKAQGRERKGDAEARPGVTWHVRDAEDPPQVVGTEQDGAEQHGARAKAQDPEVLA